LVLTLFHFYLVDFKLVEQLELIAISVPIKEEAKVWKAKIKKLFELIFKSVQVDLRNRSLRPLIDFPVFLSSKKEQQRTGPFLKYIFSGGKVR